MVRIAKGQNRLRSMAIVAVSAIAIVATVLLSTLGLQEAANATTSTTEYKKALATSLSICMDSGAFKDEVTAKSFTGIWTGGVGSIVSSNAKKAYPAGYDGTTIKKGCQDIFKEALSIGGLSLSVSSGDLGALMEKIGYESTAGESAGKCIQLTYYIKDTESDLDYYDSTKAVCIEDIDSNGIIQSTKPTVVANGGTNTVVAFTAKTGKINIDCDVWWPGEGGCGDVSFTAGTTPWTSFKDAIWDMIKNSSKGVAGRANSGEFYFTYALDLDKGVTETPYGDVTAKYVKKSDAAAIISRNLLGVSNYDFTKYETMSLYQTALVNYYKVSAIDPSKLSQDELDVRLGNNGQAGGYYETKVISNGSVVSCLVKPTQKSSNSIPAVGENGVFGGAIRVNGLWSNLDAKTIDFEGIVEWMKNNGAGTAMIGQFQAPNIECSEEHYTPTNPNPTPPGGGGSGSTDSDDDDAETISQCIEAAGSLGWILCPVLDMASDATEQLYSYIENNFLWIGENVMGSNSETHEAWKTFRDYANIAFIIMFLVVILSQITGFGVSNYGIKKILPRLIAVALLTNLSFILCQLAVDLSDIVGAGLNTALSGIGGVADASTTTYGVNAIVADARAALFGTGATTLIIAGLTWKIWLLPLLLAIIGALAGVFIFFLSLAVREAGIIILVVLCPVAIICYALPNTKKLFDKWFRIFSSLLMVYPICGLLMGGGQFASRLLVGLSTDPNVNFMFLLTAMLLSVVPFFFIPTIVRTSLNAIGQLGARLNNFGRGMSSRLTGAVRNSEGFRNKQRELAMRRDEQTVRNLDRWGKIRSAVGLNAYSKSGQRRRSLAYARADKARREDLIGESYRGRKLLRYDKAREAQLLSNLEAKDLEEGVAGNKALYRTDPRMAKEENITAEHDNVLQQFGDSPDDNELYKKLFALEQMDMEKGAPGYDLMWQSISRWIAKNNVNNSWTDNKRKALSKLSAGLATRYGKELNNFDKGANAALNHFAEGNFDKLGSFRSAIGKNGKEFYRSDYDTKLSSYSAAGLLEASPGALQRGMEAIRAGDFVNNAMGANGVIDPDKAIQLKADERTLLGNITKAFNNDLIADKFKPTEKGYLQDAMGYGVAGEDYELSRYEDGSSERKTHDIFTNMEQGTIDNLTQFVNNADSDRDGAALWQLGANIQESAKNGRVYSESDTKRIRTMLGILNTKLGGAMFKFEPASVRVSNKGKKNDQGSQQQSPIITGADAEEAFRNRNNP